jgi:hypothetical protein
VLLISLSNDFQGGKSHSKKTEFGSSLLYFKREYFQSGLYEEILLLSDTTIESTFGLVYVRIGEKKEFLNFRQIAH